MLLLGGLGCSMPSLERSPPPSTRELGGDQKGRRKLSWSVTSSYGIPRGVAASVNRTVALPRELAWMVAVHPSPLFSSQVKLGHAAEGTSTLRQGTSTIAYTAARMRCRLRPSVLWIPLTQRGGFCARARPQEVQEHVARGA
jgi:hypothetical protein